MQDVNPSIASAAKKWATLVARAWTNTVVAYPNAERAMSGFLPTPSEQAPKAPTKRKVSNLSMPSTSPATLALLDVMTAAPSSLTVEAITFGRTGMHNPKLRKYNQLWSTAQAYETCFCLAPPDRASGFGSALAVALPVLGPFGSGVFVLIAVAAAAQRRRRSLIAALGALWRWVGFWSLRVFYA